jgi:mandelate racemase
VAPLPSNQTFVEAGAHVLAISLTARWLQYLDFADAILTERLLPLDGTITARGSGVGLVCEEDAIQRYSFS